MKLGGRVNKPSSSPSGEFIKVTHARRALNHLSSLFVVLPAERVKTQREDAKGPAGGGGAALAGTCVPHSFSPFSRQHNIQMRASRLPILLTYPSLAASVRWVDSALAAAHLNGE
jgi:hypothetical protein